MNAQWKEIPQIRCMLPADLDGVVAVEHEVFLFPGRIVISVTHLTLATIAGCWSSLAIFSVMV